MDDESPQQSHESEDTHTVSNADTVKEMYAAFGRGDVPTILSKLDDNVKWDTATVTPGVPWLAPRRGRDNIPGFFEALAPLEFTKFDPHTFFEDGDKVFAIVAIEAKRNGKTYTIPNEGHLWKFNAAGKVVKYDHLTDTLTHTKMAAGQ
jgi:ketosteroid isomerase-like protein